VEVVEDVAGEDELLVPLAAAEEVAGDGSEEEAEESEFDPPPVTM